MGRGVRILNVVTHFEGDIRVYGIVVSVSVKRRLRTADCGPGVKCRLSVKCRLQTESKMQTEHKL